MQLHSSHCFKYTQVCSFGIFDVGYKMFLHIHTEPRIVEMLTDRISLDAMAAATTI